MQKEIQATLRRYQRNGVNTILKKFGGRALLADDQGLGKTLQAISIMNRLQDTTFVVVCPAPLKYNWVEEFKKFLPDEKLFVCNGRRPPSHKVENRIFIVNYDIVKHWVGWLVDRHGVNGIFCDESHYIKNLGAQRTKACLKISADCRYAVAMTGTPIENRPIELFSQIKLVNPTIFPSWMLFAVRYGGAIKGQSNRKVMNVKELHEILVEKCMVRRMKTDVLTELPDKIRQVIPLEIDNKKEYKSASSNIIGWIKSNTDLNVKSAKKAIALVKLNQLKLVAGKGKIKQIVQWVNEESQNEKIIVFCFHKEILAELAKKVDNSLVIDSSLTGEKRQAAVNEFQNNDKIRVLLSTYKVAGTGLTLTAASTVVSVQCAWNGATHDQGEDRAHRMGQKADVRAIYFVAKGTVEEKLFALIDRKKEAALGIIDGREAEEEDLLTDLLNQYLNGDDDCV